MTPPIRPAATPFQIFQRDTSSFVKRDLTLRHQKCDVSSITREVSSRWSQLSPEGKARYEKLAREDKARFVRELQQQQQQQQQHEGGMDAMMMGGEEEDVNVVDGGDVVGMDHDYGGKGVATGAAAPRSLRKRKSASTVEDDEEDDYGDEESSSGGSSSSESDEGSVASVVSDRDDDEESSSENEEEEEEEESVEENDDDDDEYKSEPETSGGDGGSAASVASPPASDASRSSDNEEEEEDGEPSSEDDSSDSDYGAPRRRSAKKPAPPSSSRRGGTNRRGRRAPIPKPDPPPTRRARTAPKPPSPPPSPPPVTKRERARIEKEENDKYITARQAQLRKERTEQARRRLEFLLGQSDIFSHFGSVKEDQARLLANRRTRSETTETEEKTTTTTTRRFDDATNTTEKTTEEEETVDDNPEKTFLTHQPSSIAFGKMRDYQLEGLNWMIRLQEHGVNGILADEMGLGKTLQSISILAYMQEYRDCDGPHLIVVPKSTLSNWLGELSRWTPSLKAIRFHGTKDERESITKDILRPNIKSKKDWNVVVTTYEVCNSDRQVLNKFAWRYLIIDEAHRLKNEASAFSKTVRTFETSYRLLLTGTPLQNNLHELWALLNFLVPDVFASSQQFDDWFNLDIDDNATKNKLISQLHKILRPFMLRRLKADVEKSLPPKHETILFTGMSALQKKLYKDILMRDIDLLSGSGTGSGSRTAILNIVMQLRKCAGHPYLFPGVEDRSLPPLGEHLVENCGKLVLLDKLLKRLRERGHRVLLFTQMTRILDILEDYLVMRRYSYCRIDGNTSYDVREESIDAYNAPNSPHFVFLLSTRAGGLGINLQSADVVILYDSDWNPQADLQAQDRAHRIGQKREVQVFRLVTEHTIEEKVVERAQQKLKLDAMVVQQGRLKDSKDVLSREDLLEAVRFGADKVFKSKDSSITDDDIDLILNIGKKKTQELNDKLVTADKGDMLDFKLDGGSIGAQTFEGVDYSQMGSQSRDKNRSAQAQAELLGILDIGKRERRAVANYNEDQLYRRQVQGGESSKSTEERKQRSRKAIRLPKTLRLPRLEEWHMFDKNTLEQIQSEEEDAFKAYVEEQQKVSAEFNPRQIDPTALPPLLPPERLKEKRRLLAEGFADWNRHHYTAFIRACAKYGRQNLSQLARAVDKPLSNVECYANAFWNPQVGGVRLSSGEYERVTKIVEKGEKKLQDAENLRRGTRVLLSLFKNPWQELTFSHATVKDKMFSPEEDRHLLCWSLKYGFRWDAVRMAVRRSHTFKYDYLFKSLPAEVLGRRCEQLMKAAEKEVEHLEKEMKNDEGGGGGGEEDAPVTLPTYEKMMERKRLQRQQHAHSERQRLEQKVLDIESDMERIQTRLKLLNKTTKSSSSSTQNNNNNNAMVEFPESLLPTLVNLVARSGSTGVMVIAQRFIDENSGVSVSKRQVGITIDKIAIKEKRREDVWDSKVGWYIRSNYEHLLSVETLRFLRKGHSKTKKEEEETWPPPFPDYNGSDPPKECKKAFTHFCNGTRREVKAMLDSKSRKDKSKVNAMLKEKWFSLTSEKKKKWKKWERWDEKRYAHEMEIYQKRKSEGGGDNDENDDENDDADGGGNDNSDNNDDDRRRRRKHERKEKSEDTNKSGGIPKKKRRKDGSGADDGGGGGSNSSSRYSSIPKKRFGNNDYAVSAMTML